MYTLYLYIFNKGNCISIYILLLLLLSRFSCVRLCDPIDGSPPGSPSLGFSRQEHWSGLPFPSPMHESEKWKWSHSVVSDSSRPHGLQPIRLLRPWNFPGKSTGVGWLIPYILINNFSIMSKILGLFPFCPWNHWTDILSTYFIYII